MIFNVPGHIDMIRNGLYHLPVDALNNPIEERRIKTQTRRVNRGIYQEGRDYAVQRKRGVKAEGDIRIEIDEIWEECCKKRVDIVGNLMSPCISIEDAKVEGGYIPYDYELEFEKAYPKWDGNGRWVFEFHVIEVQK